MPHFLLAIHSWFRPLSLTVCNASVQLDQISYRNLTVNDCNARLIVTVFRERETCSHIPPDCFTALTRQAGSGWRNFSTFPRKI